MSSLLKKTILLLLSLSFFFFFFGNYSDSIHAAYFTGACEWAIKDEFGNTPPSLQKKITGRTRLDIKIKSPAPNQDHKIYDRCGGRGCQQIINKTLTSDGGGYINLETKNGYTQTEAGGDIIIYVENPNYTTNPLICTYTIEASDWIAAPTPTPEFMAECDVIVTPLTINTNTSVTAKGSVRAIRGLDPNSLYIVETLYTGETVSYITIAGSQLSLTKIQGTKFEVNIGQLPDGDYTAKAHIVVTDQEHSGVFGATATCQTTFNVCDSGCGVPTPTPSPLPTPTDEPSCSTYPCNTPTNPCDIPSCQNCSFCRPTITPVPTLAPIPSLAPLCDQIGDPESTNPTTRKFWEDCNKCVNIDHGIWTAIGCLPTNLSALIKEKVFPIGLGFAGGAAFLYFLYGAFLILTCAGDPKKLEEAKQIIISALSGLLLIIFSVFLLKVIGVDILKLPGFE